MSATPLLDKIASPADMRGLSTSDLKQLAAELRAETIDAVSVGEAILSRSGVADINWTEMGYARRSST